MSATIYHNPRCSKSRQALALLEEQSVEFTVREYLKQPLTSNELKALILDLEIEAHDLLRAKEAEYKTAGLSKESSDSDIIKAIVEFPKLMERPIVTTSKGSRIGRPTEKLLEVL